ncbi:MAG: DUF1549 domain-containing protein, partial [Pirellulaceae bacterium]|nr:DUF1549 domain-containing protein [Pirellulaceae bacterium]
IDARVHERLESSGIPLSAPATDAEFLRRVCLDLHGVIPTAERVRTFLANKAANRRAALIDELLADPRFAAHLADLWDDYLMPAADDPRLAKQQLNAWLETAFRQRSWDRIVQELVTASGHRDENAAVSYLFKGRETLSPAELTDLVSQYFLGVRLNCAQCHDHPFASWTQDDYWGVAAFFTQIQYTDRRQMKSGVIRDDLALDVRKLENADRLREPRFPRGEVPELRVARRQALALWMTSSENPFFARAMVNRIWWQLFGRGLVEPVDDMHEGHAATHPELLAELTEQFVASGHDLRFLCGAICNSQTYQRTSRPAPGNEQDRTGYSRMAVKVFTPEQLYDSLALLLPATSTPKRFVGNADPREEFVRFFRSDGDPAPTVYDRGIPQTLRMLNAPQWFSPRGEAAMVRRLVEPEMEAPAALEQLYLCVLARTPTEDERQILADFLREHPGDREQAYAEILWALVNGSEFSLNH